MCRVWELFLEQKSDSASNIINSYGYGNTFSNPMYMKAPQPSVFSVSLIFIKLCAQIRPIHRK